MSTGRNKWAFGETHYNMFPELRYFMEGQVPNEEVEVYFRVQKSWPTMVAIVYCVLAAYPLFLLFHRVFDISRGYAAGLLIFVNVLVTWLLLSLVFPKIRRRRIRAALRERLCELGITTCRKCAYDLRGSPGRCPECGTVA